MNKESCLLLLALLSTANGAPNCDDGWVAFKDDICIKIFADILKTFEEAKEFCSVQGEKLSKPSLVMVKELDFQIFLVNYTAGISDHVWLGGRYNYETDQFNWQDGQSFTFTNWQHENQRNSVNSNDCVELIPTMIVDPLINNQGKWADVACEKRNLVMCQKNPVALSLEQEIADLRRGLDSAFAEIRKLKHQINEALIPSGFIYIQFFNQPVPQLLWRDYQWEWVDISKSFNGTFFRALGGNSGKWEQTQDECYPRIAGVAHSSGPGADYYSEVISIETNGWSKNVRTGFKIVNSTSSSSMTVYDGLHFNTQYCEVRPKNQAIKIWQRV